MKTSIGILVIALGIACYAGAAQSSRQIDISDLNAIAALSSQVAKGLSTRVGVSGFARELKLAGKTLKVRHQYSMGDYFTIEAQVEVDGKLISAHVFLSDKSVSAEVGEDMFAYPAFMEHVKYFPGVSVVGKPKYRQAVVNWLSELAKALA